MGNTVKAEAFNPQSFNEFVSKHSFSSTQEALGAYSLQLNAYREALAESLGINVEDLREISA